MPQLDPLPWFFILTTSWAIFLFFAPIKLTKFQHLNDPALGSNKSHNSPWTWPWP